MSKPHHRSLWCITNNERLALDLGWEWKKHETRKYIYDDRLSALFISWVINWCILFSVCMYFSHLFDPYFVNSCVMVGIVMVSWNYFLHFINNKTTSACWILSIIFNILLGIKDNDKQDCLIESFIDLYFVIKIFNIILNFFSNMKILFGSILNIWMIYIVSRPQNYWPAIRNFGCNLN